MIMIDDTSGPVRMQVPATLSVDLAKQQLRLIYKLPNSAGGFMSMPLDALTRSLDAVGPVQPPRCATAWSVADHERDRVLGPYANHAAACAVAKCRGGDAGVTSERYAMWHDSDGLLWGLVVVGTPRRVYETAPEDAELEAVLTRLDAAERAVVERAIAARR